MIPETQPNPESVESLLTGARAFLTQQRWDAAAQLYEQIIEVAPLHVEALEGLGLTALQTNQNETALGWLQLAQENAPTNANVLGLLGTALKRNGRLSEALSVYENALSLDSECYPAVVNLARTLRELGKLHQAVVHFERATQIAPRSADAMSMLSNARRELDDLSGALSAALDALHIDPLFADAHVNRAAALLRLGRFSEASISFFCAWTLAPTNRTPKDGLRRAFQAAKTSPSEPSIPLLDWIQTLTGPRADTRTWLLLADWEQNQGRPENALVCFEHLVTCAESAPHLRTCARLLWGFGLRGKAKARLRRAIELDDGDVEAHRLLATWATLERSHDAAELHWRKVANASPKDTDALVNLASALVQQSRPSEASRVLERALDINPRMLEAHINLGLALCDQGRFTDARRVYERGLGLEDHRVLLSNWLFSMHYDPEVTPAQLFEHHVRVAQQIEAKARVMSTRDALEKVPDRVLRIGFISPDFRAHPVAFLLEPYLKEHDSTRFQLHGYSDVITPDAMTARLAQRFHSFSPCTHLTDEALAGRVQADRIDILFDLAGHTARNRLATFALRPSPIQVSWLGYFSTTGLHAIDFRLADIHSVPEEMERYFTERIIRLPRTANCYEVPVARPVGLSERPREQVVFGCFNNPSKITREVVATFARILHNVPSSQLILKYRLFSDPDLRAKYVDWFREEDIPASRLELRSSSPIERYFDEFADIDIALDPFPYSGEATALHTLWMGVPMVAKQGSTLVQRLASRVLHVAGFDSWVASSCDEYVHIASSLAQARFTLEQRQGIRKQFEQSPLMDYAGFARDFEATLRKLWCEYCTTN